ncbi:2-oxoglutarate ferredoxin oxidoreductase subunit gamma [Spirochaetia bacterium]|nr:2-oxoglutarate ferredoxin oxidoreductase subunit gamma [Spirochaetia bacterium]
MADTRSEILISGFGGQGVVLTGRILGYAAVLVGLRASMLISHGTETRGGYVRSQVVIADGDIDSPIVENPDIFCALSQASYTRFFHLAKTGVILYDPDFVKPDAGAAFPPLAIPARALAVEKLGAGIYANIIMLGVILRKLDRVSLEKGIAAVEAIVPRNKAENRRALETGYGI